MMNLFSLLESFFFLFLGISFVLILLMVYHFKKRMDVLEKTNESLGDVCKTIVQEMHLLKTASYTSEVIGGAQMPKYSYEPIPEHIFMTHTFGSNPNPNLDQHEIYEIQHDEEEEEEEEDEDHTNEEDEEEESDDDDSVAEEVNHPKVILSDLDPLDKNVWMEHVVQDLEDTEDPNSHDEESDESIKDITDITDTMEEVAITTETIPDHKDHKDHKDTIQVQKLEETEPLEEINMIQPEKQDKKALQKMNVQMLRTMVIQDGLCTEPSKMKKLELIELILANQNEHSHMEYDTESKPSIVNIPDEDI